MLSISQDERERAIFRSRRMYQTDLASNIATAEDRGRRQGKREGIREGKREEQIDIAKRLIKMGLSAEKVSKATNLTIPEVESLC